MQKVNIYTDGSCKADGRGGWGALIRVSDDHEHEISGCERRTTNNRMELLAAIKALAFLEEPCQVILFTDSQYMVRGITSWIKHWKNNNWKSTSGKTIKNVDLWIQLDMLQRRHKVSWRWVKGHSGNKYNNRADRLARSAIK